MEQPSEEEEEYDSENMSYASEEEEEPVKPIRRVSIVKPQAKQTTTRQVRNVVQKKIREPSASQTVTESEEDDYNEPMTQDFKRRGL